MICIVGPSCAGKTTMSEWLEKRYDLIRLEASDFAAARHIAESADEPIIDYVDRVFTEQGKHTFAVAVVEKIEANAYNPSSVIISGFRAPEEIDYIQTRFGPVRVFGVYANSRIRFERSIQRQRPQSPKTYEDFIIKDMREYGFGIANCLSH